MSSGETDLIESALTYSDNEAYASLMKIIGVKNLRDYGKSLGFTGFITDESNNYYSDTTVENQLILWKKIWDFINTNEYGEELKKFLKNNNLNYLNFNSSISSLHKYGAWDEYFHDVGIILDDSQYIIVVLTKEGNNNYPKIIRNLSEKLYNFNKLIK